MIRHTRFWFLMLTAFVCLGTAFAQSQQALPPEPAFRPSIEGRFDYAGTFSVSHGSIPLAYRQIPHHPSDPAWRFTVPDNALSSYLNAGYASALVGFTFGGVTLRGGPQFMIFAHAPGPAKNTTANTKEVNQNGTKDRGTGTSLVYINGKVATVSNIGYLAEADVRVHKRFSLIGGYSVSEYDFAIGRGYDRNDALEALDEKPYGRDKVKNPYFGVRVNSDRLIEPTTIGFYALAGPNMITTTPITGIGLSPYDQTKWGFRLGLSFGYIRSAKH